MLTPYESRLLIRYLKNIVARVYWRDTEAGRLICWLLTNEKVLLRVRSGDALARWAGTNADLASARVRHSQDPTDKANRWEQLGEAIGYARRAAGEAAMDLRARRLNWYGAQLRLHPVDLAVLEALVRYATHPVVGDLVDTVFSSGLPWNRSGVLPVRVLACMVGVTPQELEDRLMPPGPLRKFGLVAFDNHWGITASAHVRLLTLASDSGKGIRPTWLRRMPSGPFEWKDFEHLGQDRLDAETLLASAFEQGGERGVNILVHGPVHAGKEGFCTVLAERAGVTLYRVTPRGSCLEDGPSDRIRTLLLAQSLVREKFRASLLADGLDTRFTERVATRRLIRLLNDTPVPTLWTATDPGYVPKRVLRQMAFAVRMQPAADLRARLWVSVLARQGVDATLRDAKVLAEDYGAAPGVAANVAASAGGLDLVARSVQSLWPLLARRQHREAVSVRLRSLDDLLPSCVERLNTLRHGGSIDPDVATGYEELDRLTGGLQRGELIVVAGRPSMGKSALVLNIAERAAMEMRQSVAIFSLELTKEQILMRMLSSTGRVDQSRVRTGQLTEKDLQRIDSAISSMSEARIFIDDSPGLTVAELSDRLGRLKREQDLGLAMVDYLQLIRSGTDSNSSRAATLSEIVRSLKNMAKELDLPVIAVSQLGLQLEHRSDKQPVLGDLPGSGAIEDHADVILFIYRDEVYDPDSPRKGIAEITLAKQRNGPTGVFRLEFNHEFMRFDNYLAPE